MNTLSSKVVHYITNGILSLYIAIVIALTLCFQYTAFILTTLVITCIVFVIILLVDERISQQSPHVSSQTTPNQPSWKIIALVFTIILVGQLFYFFAYYPGGFNLDALGQWGQAHGDYPYDDWHPFVSTMWIKFVLLIHDSLPFYILSQALLFSAAFAKLSDSLFRIGIKPIYIIICAVLVSLSPSVGMNNVCLTKDVQFTILIILLTDISIQIMLTPFGDWVTKPFNVCYTSAILFFASTVRHNGILYTIPFLLLLALIYQKCIPQVIVITIVTILSITIVKDPIEQSLYVTPHSNTVGESVGIPMAIMANALVNDSDHIPVDVHTFLNQIADDDDWHEYYITGEWDSCKWEFGGTELLRDVNLLDILKKTAQTIVACPQASYESIRENTRIFWQVVGESSNWIADMYFCENEYGLLQNPNPVLNDLANNLIQLSGNTSINWLVWNTGYDILIFVILLYFSINHSVPKMMLLFIPLLCYDFGTMLLLAGPNHRYFYLNKCLVIPITLCAIHAARKRVSN